MGTTNRSTDAHAWGPTGTREPVFAWTPPDPTAGRAVLGRVTPEREGGTPPDRLRVGTYLASSVTAVALYELVTEEVGRRLGVPSGARPPRQWTPAILPPSDRPIPATTT